MAGGIDVKMGVSGIAQYKQSMAQAQQSVKTLDAALKLNEKQLQATGDKETYMANKSKLLKQQIAEQNTVVKQGQAALAAMEKQGVSPASAAYQKMQQQVLNAQAALLDMNGDLNTVGQSADETAQKTDRLTSSLNGINKKVSFDAVLNGIGKITDGMEAAARKVEGMARDVWDTMAMAASWADSENTLAAMYGIDVETLQRMQGASRTIDTSVEAIIKSRQKLKQNMVSDSKEIADAFTQLGVRVGYATGKHNEIQTFRDWENVFWDVGAALLNYNDEVERDVLAQRIFGRSWMELMPLFQAGRAEYQKTMDDQSIVTQQNMDKLNALDDALQKLDQDYQATKRTLLSEFAPAFTEVGKTASGLLREFNEYLQTDDGKEKLGELSSAVTDLFSGLSDADFGVALNSAKTILDSVVESLKWIHEHSGDVEGALKVIGGGFLALKAAEVVGTLAQGASALKNLLGGGSGAGSAAAGAGGSSSSAAAGAAGGGFWSWLTKSAINVLGTDIPGWLYGLSTGALFKTGMEVNEQLPLGLYGDLLKRQQMQEISVAGYVDPVTGEIYSKEEWQAMQEAAQRPVGEPKRPKNITGTAPDESMKGTVENLYNELYKAISSYSPELEGAPSMVDFYKNVLEPKVEDFAALQGVAEEDMQSIKNVFIDAFARSFEDDWEGTTDGIMSILQDAIDEKAQGLTVETTPDLVDNAADLLQGQMSGVTLHVPVIPDLASVSLDGEHANGLPFVPFDGYIAALHRGERVVPASQNKSYTNTSNVYFDHVNVNNGTDVDGMAAMIAERAKHTLAGFGG